MSRYPAWESSTSHWPHSRNTVRSPRTVTSSQIQQCACRTVARRAVFSCTLSILTNCTAHGFIRRDTLPKGPAADNLLFWRRRFFKRNTAFSVEFTDGSLQHNAEILPDKYRVRARQLQCRSDAHRIKRFEILRPTPQISSTGCRESSLSVRFGLPEVRASTPPNCRHSLDAHCALFSQRFGRPHPDADCQPRTGAHVLAQLPAEVLIIDAAVYTADIQKQVMTPTY